MRSADDETAFRVLRSAARPGASWPSLAGAACLPRPAQAVLELDITQGIVEPLPIAITELYGETPAAQQRGREIADVVSADLERSGLFRPIDRRAFIQSPAELHGPAALRRLAPDQRRGAGHRHHHRRRGGRRARGRVPAVGRLRRHPDARPALCHLERQLAPRRRIRSPMRSTSGSPARSPISTPGSSTSARAGRAPTASSASRSWTRTAPTTAS